MLKKLSLKNQFILTFAAVIFLSIVSTVCTLILIYSFLFIYNEKSVLPANHYEKQVPSIEKFVEMNGDKIVDLSYQKKLEKVIPMQGITYQVMNTNGNRLYGTLSDELLKNDKEVYHKINTSTQNGKLITKYIPIISNGKLVGVLAVRY
ncbi:two-component sensor histidine kinase, partial [Bacillus mycoides]